MEEIHCWQDVQATKATKKDRILIQMLTICKLSYQALLSIGWKDRIKEKRRDSITANEHGHVKLKDQKHWNSNPFFLLIWALLKELFRRKITFQPQSKILQSISFCADSHFISQL